LPAKVIVVKIRTNIDKLVRLSVMGEAVSPIVSRAAYKVTADGRPVVLPGVGGITYNVRVGDLASGWEADHVEPGVSIENKEEDKRFPEGPNAALNILACVGNEAIVAIGDAKGAKGTVTGKHGGIEHVLADFQPEAMERLMLQDKILIKAYGVGFRLLDLPEVKVMNTDPIFFEAMDPKIVDEKLEVPVTHKVPASVMGSGLGASQVYSGDYDITLFDEATKKKHGLDDIRLGDLVAIMDADHSYGRIYKQGAVSVGIVVHSDCVIAGHGPGVTTLLTSTTGAIATRIESKANIANLLKLR
jgi:hypothetical protein